MLEKLDSRKNIFKGKVIEVTVDTITNVDGLKATREVVHHSGAACVVPIEDDGTVYMVQQFRYPFNEYMLEIPAGKKDINEDHRITAIRELKEETGITAKNLVYLGEYRGNVAILTEKIHMYLATGLLFSQQNLDEGEYVEVKKYHINDVVDMIFKNEIKDGKTISAILLAKNYLDNRQ